MKQKFISILFIIICCFSYSQESAKNLIDSAINSYKQEPEKAITVLEKALNIAVKNNSTPEVSLAKNYLGLVYRDLGKFDKAKTYSLESLSITKDSIIMASAYNNIGACNRQLGLYEEALKVYLKALSIYEAVSNENKIATVTNNIGLVYSYLGINDKAIEYHLIAKKTFELLNDNKGMSQAYNNIAIIYANDGNLDKALNYFQYSLNIEEKLNDKKGIAESANNVGAVYYYLQEIDSALYYFNKSARIEKTIGNLAGLGASYNNIAQVLIENNRVLASKKYIDSAYFYAKQYKTSVDIETALFNYSQYYEAKNNTKQALKYYKDYSKFKDSVLNIQTNSKVAELEIEYQTEKKEKQILSQRADIAEKELRLNKKNTQILGLCILAIVISALGYLFFKQQKLKNQQLKKESELKEALIKIETQNRLQDQRLRISRDLHDNIGAQLTFIISSIENLQYGFKIKNEKLTSKLSGISTFTKDTIYELRDTIWAMNKNAISLEDLETRISNFIDKAGAALNTITFSFNIDKSLSKNLEFTSLIGMNVYRIIQEAINNAIKYSSANKVSVNIYKTKAQIKIEIEDNGKGFVEAEESGNGLNNMKKRARDINANFNIESVLNKGTKIIVVLKA